MKLNKVVDDVFWGCIHYSTKRAHISGFKCVIRFCNLILHHVENTSIQIYQEIILEMWFLYFIAYCQSLIGLKFSTIKLYLTGVCHFGIAYANRNPLVDQYGNQLLRLHKVLQKFKILILN
jgi:hypothetical protein